MDSHNNENKVEQSSAQNTNKAPEHGKDDRKLFGILSYVGPLIIFPLIMKKDDPFVKFHVKQGLVLISIQVILWVLSSGLMLWSFWPIYKVIHLAVFILAILGIVNVVQNKERELPFVGGFAKHFPI